MSCLPPERCCADPHRHLVSLHCTTQLLTQRLVSPTSLPPCPVCPFMLVGEAAQKARSSVQGLPPMLKWPKQAESAGPWAMLVLFAGVAQAC